MRIWSLVRHFANTLTLAAFGKWEVRTACDHNGPLQLKIPPAELSGLRDFDVHVTLVSSSGIEGSTKAYAGLSGLRIEGKM